jgi:4-hydroxybenzoate polyprenyltransferase
LVLPLLQLLKKTYRAVGSEDFHSISTHLKWVMLAGILSMLFFKYYTI